VAVDIELVERELRRIPEVRAARILTDDSGVPVEVHVLATPAKHATQLVRDVQSVAIATGGIEIDQRIVSVVQLEENDSPSATPAAQTAEAIQIIETIDRPSLVAVVVERADLRCAATVRLRNGNGTVEGRVEGSVAGAAVRRSVAEATLAAVTQLRPAAGSASVEGVSTLRLGDHEVVLAVLAVVVPPYEEIVTGSAQIRAAGPDEAVARAVLAACNRRLAR
jgi:hypothetical protein